MQTKETDAPSDNQTLESKRNPISMRKNSEEN